MDIRTLLVFEEQSMIESMQRLDEAAKKILFVVSDSRLLASITDGDIRRWILKKGSLDAKVRDIANYCPKYLHEKDRGASREFMLEHAIEALPLVNDDKEIMDIIFLNEWEMPPKARLDIPVVIMAGGEGTRLYPYTKVLPKPLIPIGEIPIAEHIMNRFFDFGIDQFHLIVNHKKNMIKAYFNETERPYSIFYADEDRPMGTGGGLYLLKDKIHTTFILSNCDILVDEDYGKIVDFHKKEKNFITLICSLKKIQIPYGIVEIGEKGEIEEMREKPNFSFFTNTGVYIVEPEVIQEMEKEIAVGFPDIISEYKEKGKKIGIYPISENSWMDMGQPKEMEKMRLRLESPVHRGR